MAVNRLIQKKASLLARLLAFKDPQLASHDVLWIDVDVNLARFQPFLFSELERLLEYTPQLLPCLRLNQQLKTVFAL